MRTNRGWIAVILVCLLCGSSGKAAGQAIEGIVRDARTNDPVVSALIQLGQTEHYTVSDEGGRFNLNVEGASGPQVLIVSAPGYAKRYEPGDPSSAVRLVVLLSPEPIELEGVEGTVVSYRTRMRRRMQDALSPAHAYAIEGSLLEKSTAPNVWELVRVRHGFRFERFSDYGCPMVTINGSQVQADIFIDDRPARLETLQEHMPQDFAVVEVMDYGHAIRAYTQKYLDWATEHDKQAVPFLMYEPLCPRPKVAPGTLERGRPVGKGSE
ncbi:MAG: carboxypeptidase regulatory-like domain-containing protein [Longimicrobiales bacterium]